MTPEQAEQLANHAATTWSVLPNVWAARMLGWDYAVTRNALSRLRMRGGNPTLPDLVAEVDALLAAAAGPCQRCGGTRWLTTHETSRVVFATDTTEVPATVIAPPELDETATTVDASLAWIAAIRAGRERGHVETRQRTIAVTAPCPDCTFIIRKENP